MQDFNSGRREFVEFLVRTSIGNEIGEISSVSLVTNGLRPYPLCPPPVASRCRDLVGKRGVVKSAQTLGGWHEVLLEVRERLSIPLHGQKRIWNGELIHVSPGPTNPYAGDFLDPMNGGTRKNSSSVVRVQRNALEIVSLMGMEEDSNENGGDQGVGTATINGRNSSYSGNDEGGIAGARPHPPKRRKRKHPLSHSVNLGRLDEATLRRYRRYFNLNVRKDCERDELVFAVRRHFARTKVNEVEVILDFLQKVGKSKGSG